MDSTLACLVDWMPRQRWYASKGQTPTLARVASLDLASEDPGAHITTHFIADTSAVPPIIYQVPVVTRAMSEDFGDAADPAGSIIGRPEPGVVLIDGAHDPAYTAALLGLVTAGSAEPITATASVLRGEQSNTSLIFRPADPGTPPIICKIYRQLHAGLNPDIELQSALSRAGSPFVPETVGSLAGEWRDTGGEIVRGSLAFAQEFLPGVEDAWRVALSAAAADDDFASAARDLGAATAQVHLALAGLFPTTASSPEHRTVTRESWQHRLATAIADVPALDEVRAAIERVYDDAAMVDWPALQRIHGDFHLGQVILVPGRGWVLLDFEGEPLRPMSERVLPDLALRDVAGMLRSFDYVAGSLRLENPDSSQTAITRWAEIARGAFRTGYAEASGVDPASARALLAALELDKAVYETIYEARNRPAWLPIPLEAISRLTAPLRSGAATA